MKLNSQFHSYNNYSSSKYVDRSQKKTPNLEVDLFSSSSTDKFISKQDSSGGITDKISFSCVPGEKLGEMQLEVAIHASQGVPGANFAPLVYKRNVPASELMKLKSEQPRNEKGRFSSKDKLENTMPKVIAMLEHSSEQIDSTHRLSRQPHKKMHIHSGFLCDELMDNRKANFVNTGTELRNVKENKTLTVPEQIGFLLDVASKMVAPGSDVSQGIALAVMKKMMAGVGVVAHTEDLIPGDESTRSSRVVLPGEGIRGSDYEVGASGKVETLLGGKVTAAERRAVKADLAAVTESLK